MSGEDSAPLTDEQFAAQVEEARKVQESARQRIEAERGPLGSRPVTRLTFPPPPLLTADQEAELEAQGRREDDRRSKEREEREALRRTALPRGFTLRFGGDESWLASAPFKDFPKAVAFSRSVALSNPLRAVWVGSAGAGKTSLAVAALARWLDEHEGRVLFVSARELAVAWDRWPVGVSEPPLVERANAADLLLLDDLGEERSMTMSAVSYVLHKRHEQGMRTWVTTWCSDEDLCKRYGDGITRRIFDRAEVCTFDQPLGK